MPLLKSQLTLFRRRQSAAHHVLAVCYYTEKFVNTNTTAVHNGHKHKTSQPFQND